MCTTRRLGLGLSFVVFALSCGGGSSGHLGSGGGGGGGGPGGEHPSPRPSPGNPLDLRHTSPHASNPNKIPLNEIFEVTAAKDVDYGPVANFDDVTFTVEFTAPLSGRITEIDGFYYYTVANGRSLWKARFVPGEIGLWSYRCTWTHLPSGKTETGKGRFEVIPSELAGFVHPSSTNPFRLEYPDGTPFYPIGFNDDIALDGGDRVGAFRWLIQNDESFLTMQAEAGFNAYRMRNKNGFGAICDDDPSINGNGFCEVFLRDMSITFDERMRALHEHGIAIYYAIFGNLYHDRVFPAKLSPEDRKLIAYSVNRWAAYVQVWQLNNELSPPDSWVIEAAQLVRRLDPYQHPISESWGEDPLPKSDALDINAPHCYATEDEHDSDKFIAVLCAKWKKYQKPVLVGEQGNKPGNPTVIPEVSKRAWQPESERRMRLRAWTAYFNEVAIFFYGRGHTDSSSGLYLGRDERKDVQTLRRFVECTLHHDTAPASVTVSDPLKMRAYALRAPQTGVAAAYVHRYLSHQGTQAGLNIFMDVPKPGQGIWIDTDNGKVVTKVNMQAGQQWIAVPPIQVDLAFFTAPPGLDVKPLARYTIVNPQDDGDLDDDGVPDYGPKVAPFGAAPLTLTFDAANSSDWDGGPLQYKWELGDGQSWNGPSIAHTYVDSASYPVTLTVTDDEGNTAQQGFWVHSTADLHWNKNDPPIMARNPFLKVWGGQAVYIRPEASDWELASGGYQDDGLFADDFSATGLPPGASYEQIKHAAPNAQDIPKEMIWVPDFDEGSVYLPTFIVQDPKGLHAEERVRILVSVPPKPLP